MQPTHPSRRRFISTTTAAFAGAPFVLRGQSKTDRPTSAVIGVGSRGNGIAQTAVDYSDVLWLCDVNEARAKNIAGVPKFRKKTPKVGTDFRRVLDDKAVDAVFIATPHHWHTPIAVRALEAGKHVYVEKPASHVFAEGRLLIEAARKAKRLVQHGTQMRSSEVTMKADEILKSGLLGEIKLSRGWSIEPRNHPAPVPNSKPPDGLDYETWLGPAPKRPYNRNRVGRWRWYRDYGNGEMGDDGIHDIDLAVWGLGVDSLPVKISAHGADINLTGETEYPNHCNASFQYADGREVLYETRNWAPYRMHGFDSGNTFYGTNGYMVFSRRGYFQTYLGGKEEKGPGMKGGHGSREHVEYFLKAVAGKKAPTFDAEVAHRSCALVHLGEIAFRLGRTLAFDPKTETFPHDAEATAMLTKKYRGPWGFKKT
jgi:predicted dehydrogenase